jgi:hypothetical protein
MPVYMIISVCTVAVSGIIMSVIFHRLKVFNFRTIASVTLASLITALVMPGIFSALSAGENDTDASFLLIITIAAFVAYMAIVFILSILISYLVPNSKTDKKAAKPAAVKTADPAGANASAGSDAGLVSIDAASVNTADQQASDGSTASVPETLHRDDYRNSSISDAAGTDAAGSNFLEQIYLNYIGREEEKPAEQAETGSNEPDLPHGEETYMPAEHEEAYVQAGQEEAYMPVDQEEAYLPADQEETYMPAGQENTETDLWAGLDTGYTDKLSERYGENDEITAEIAGNVVYDALSEEKSVDSTENIDKMGIENNIHDGGAMTIEECIDEAYRLRELGDLEGSIIYYMYALDKNPQKDLTFWIILDICVMYKSLGQQSLALDILNSYYDIYGDTMGNDIREEIQRNLAEVSA